MAAQTGNQAGLLQKKEEGWKADGSAAKCFCMGGSGHRWGLFARAGSEGVGRVHGLGYQSGQMDCGLSLESLMLEEPPSGSEVLPLSRFLSTPRPLLCPAHSIL